MEYHVKAFVPHQLRIPRLGEVDASDVTTGSILAHSRRVPHSEPRNPTKNAAVTYYRTEGYTYLGRSRL